MTRPRLLDARVLGLLALGLIVRLVWAAGAPLANDEAYYWDWGRSLQLSYLDHPPGVAWLAAGAGLLAGGALGARLLVPFLHIAAALFQLGAARELKGEALTGREALWVLALTELVPAFGLEGVLLLPDAGLLAAMAAALFFALRLGRRARLADAVLLGATLGLAGLCKYHAAPLAAGLLAALLVRRPQDWPKVLVAGVVAVVATTPVLAWNATHGWASFRFQSNHGLGGLSFDPLAGARVVVGLLVLLSPWVFGRGWALACRGWSGLGALPRASFWALAAPLTVIAFFKQELPHWTAPAFWMLVPCLALLPEKARPAKILSFAFAAVLSVGAPWVLAVSPLRAALVGAFHGDPGFLAELTIWQPLVQAARADPRLVPSGGAPQGCPAPYALASLRWYSTAQLAFWWPGQPRVYSLDFNHLSFYSFRDDLTTLAHCPVLILGDRDHFDRAQLGAAVDIAREVDVSVPGFAASHMVALTGRFRSREALAALPTPAATFRGGGAPAAPASEPTSVYEDVVPLSLPMDYRPLTQVEALQVPAGTPDLGRPCAVLPMIRGELNAHIQVPEPRRTAISINLGTRAAAWHGTLHSHTGDSDAEGSVEEAFRYARDIAGLDFFAVTDHPEYWLLREADHLQRARAAAAAAARPGFVALAGFEYSSPIFGHYVVLNTSSARNSFEDPSPSSFYAWLQRPEQAGALVTFAHPGFHEYRKSVEFDHFRLDPDVVGKLIAVEVLHWNGYESFMKGYDGRFSYLDEALRHGWRVGAEASQDVHYANWGTRDSSRVGLLMPSLSKANVLAAIKQRHFFATNNRHLQFAVNLGLKGGRWAMMGDAVPRASLAPETADLKVRYYDKDCTDWPQMVEVVVNGHVVSAYEFPDPRPPGGFPFAGELTVRLPLRQLPKKFYVYARFYADTDDSTFTESSPIFVDP